MKVLKLIIGTMTVTLILTIGILLTFNREVGYAITDYTIKNVDHVNGEGLEPKFDTTNVQPYSSTAAVKALNQAKNVRASGQLALPGVDINLPIYEGVNDVHLYLGAAETRPRTEVKPGDIGNYTVASHYIENKGSLFEPLHNSKPGEKIYVAFDKNIYVYNINTVIQVTENDGQWLNDIANKKLITLYSCVSYDLTSGRWVVQGELDKVIPLNEFTPKEIVDVFNTKNNTLKGTYLEAYENLRPE